MHHSETLHTSYRSFHPSSECYHNLWWISCYCWALKWGQRAIISMFGAKEL